MRDTFIFRASTPSAKQQSEDEHQPPPLPKRLKIEPKIASEQVLSDGKQVFLKNEQPLIGKTLKTKFKDDEDKEHDLILEVWFLPGKASETGIDVQKTFQKDYRDMEKIQAKYWRKARDLYIGLLTSNIPDVHLQALKDSKNKELETQLIERYGLNNRDELMKKIDNLPSEINQNMTSSNMFDNRNDVKYMYLICPCEGGHFLSLIQYNNKFPLHSKHLIIQYLTQLSTIDKKIDEVVCTGIMSFHKNKIIYIDGESGTYKPEDKHVKEAQRILSTAIHKSFVIPILDLEISAAFRFLNNLPTVLRTHPDRTQLTVYALEKNEKDLDLLLKKYKTIEEYREKASVQWSCFDAEVIQPMPQIVYSEELRTIMKELKINMSPVDDCCLIWFPESRKQLEALLLRNGYTTESVLETS